MKRFHRILIGAVLLAIGPLATASPGSLTSFPPRVMPVFVHVNSLGKVTEVQPSTQLSPRLRRLLASSLRQWISKPALVDGHPVDSYSIVNVALHATPRKDGKYDASFAFVSIAPAPFTSGYWAGRNFSHVSLVDSPPSAYDFNNRRFSAPASHFRQPGASP